MTRTKSSKPLAAQHQSKRKLEETQSPPQTNATSSEPSPAKKQKQNPSAPVSRAPLTTPQHQPPKPASKDSNDTTLDISALLEPLAQAYNVTSMSIISSSQIQKKVARALECLAVYPTPAGTRPNVVMLYAKAPVVAKLISIVEITKRDVAAKGGKWFQYNMVEANLEERKKKRIPVGEDRSKSEEGVKVSGKGGEDEEAFETMKTPFERAIEGKPKIRAMPVMVLYLSRVRIDNLRKAHDEQTNGLAVPSS